MNEPKGVLTDETGQRFNVKLSRTIREGYDDEEKWYWLVPAEGS